MVTSLTPKCFDSLRRFVLARGMLVKGLSCIAASLTLAANAGLRPQQRSVLPWARRALAPCQGQDVAPTVEVNKCLVGLPDALSFVEPLAEPVQPEDVVIFSGGDSHGRRTSGFGLLTSKALEDFAGHHGYKLVFLDQINYDRSLMYGGLKFKPQWHRVFAMPELRKTFPTAKYFVWFDDDVLTPYKETDTLNHYINMMEEDPEWEMMYGEEGAEYILNSGLFIMKNSDFSFRVYNETLDVGLEEDGRLAFNQHMEQEAIAILRDRHRLHPKIRVIKHRDGPYSFNTFARDCSWDPPGVKSEDGDAFVHFLGGQAKFRNMNGLLAAVNKWRKERPEHCTYPVALN